MRPPGFPGNPPARMPRAPTPARSPPPRPLRGGDVAFRPTQDVGPRDQCISGLNHAAYALPVNASRPGSPQAHASLGSGWWPTLAGWGWIPTGFRTRFRRSHHGILSPLTGLSRHTRWCTNRNWHATVPTTGASSTDGVGSWAAHVGHRIQHIARELRFDRGFVKYKGPVSCISRVLATTGSPPHWGQDRPSTNILDYPVRAG